MKKHVKFPSIEQFRNVIANVNRTFNFTGLDENGEPMYDVTKNKPVLTFDGTVKLHGTNAGVCYNETGGLWAQSRTGIITPTPEVMYEIEFEDGTKELYGENTLINDKIISDYKEGDML